MDARDTELYLNNSRFPAERYARVGATPAQIAAMRAYWESQPLEWRYTQAVATEARDDAYVASTIGSWPGPVPVALNAVTGPNPPANPSLDSFWYDESAELWKRWNGTSWLASGSGTYAPVGAGITRLRAVAIGDSTTSGGLRSVDGTVVQVGNTWAAMDAVGAQQAGPQSWFTWACLFSGGRLLNVYNAGIASDTTTGMLARFSSDVVAKAPDVVFIGDAHNDFSNGSGISEATTRANITAMVSQAKAAGIMPILRLCYPDNNPVYAYALRRHNDWLRRYAAANHLICVDTYSPVVDTTSTAGAWVAANTADGTHATTAGAILAGQRVVNDLAGLLAGNTTTWGPFAAVDRVGGTGRTVTLTAATSAGNTLTASGGAFSTKDIGRLVTYTGSPSGLVVSGYSTTTQVTLSQTVTIPNGTVVTLGPHENLLWNPMFQDDANADGAADSWSWNGTITKTLITDAAVVGQVQSLQVTAGTASGYQQLSTDAINFRIGDRVKWSGLCKIVGAAGSLNFDLLMNFGGAASTYVVKPLGQTVGVDLGWFYYECDGVIPTGTTWIRFGFTTYGGTGTLLFAQQKVTNLTLIAAADTGAR